MVSENPALLLAHREPRGGVQSQSGLASSRSVEKGWCFGQEGAGFLTGKGAWPVKIQPSYWPIVSHGAGLGVCHARLQAEAGLKEVWLITGRGRGFQPDVGAWPVIVLLSYWPTVRHRRGLEPVRPGFKQRCGKGAGFVTRRGGVSNQEGAWPVIAQPSYWPTVSHGAGLRASQAWLQAEAWKRGGASDRKGRGF